jgi:zinc transporter 1/2/3
MAEADEAQCDLTALENYNLGLQIASVFIVLAASLTGSILPALTEKTVDKAKRKQALALFKVFGGGIILSTALVHMLGPSMEIFGNPCIPEAFKTYPSWAPVFALAGVLISQLLRSFGAHSHDEDELALANKKKSQVFLLEFGIVMHSVLIGFSLGTLGGEEQVAFLIAICFHQFFEGTAVSAIVIDQFRKRKMMSIVLILLFVLSTPIGIAIGIAARLSHENDPSMLLAEGILEGLAAGILLYDGLVSIIAPFFTSSIYSQNSQLFRWASIFLLWLGVATMSIIGNWA